MTLNSEKLLESILESLDRISFLSAKELPDIPLYMDQVTTYLSDRLKASTRYPDSDKILTKTMINNYAKNRLLPPPENKKYTKEHLIYLLFIYYYKGVLSIGDIQTLFAPIRELTGKEGGMELADIYDEVFSLSDEAVSELKKQVTEQFQGSLKTFDDMEGEEGEFLRCFSFICMLSFDVYVKKLLIEKLVDGLAADRKEKAEQKTKRPLKDKLGPKRK